MYPGVMRGKTGYWGVPFTKANANDMRERGLRVRRFNSARRLLKSGERGQRADTGRIGGHNEEVKWEMREVRPGVHVQVVISPSTPASP